MKHTVKICATLLLAVILVLSVCLMTGCKDDNKDDATASGTAADRGDTVASGTAPDGTEWAVYENGELAITGTPDDGIMYDYNKSFAVPAWKAYAGDITGVTLDDSIKSISADAFSSMKNVVWVQFGKELEVIGDNAFRSCSNLRRLVLPDGVTNIGKNAFDGCYRMYEAQIPDSVTTIDLAAFAGCSSLLTVTFPAGDVTVADGVFADSFKLTEVITGNKDVEAGSDDYGGVARYASTAGVHNAEAESVLTYTDDGFVLSNKGKNVIGYIGSETSITIPDGATSVGSNAFYANTAITSVDLGDAVTMVGKNAFGGCTNLETLTVGAKIASVDDGAFSGLSGLKTLYFNAAECSEVTVEGMFENCTALTTIHFGDEFSESGASLPTGEGMFRGCTALKTVTLPPVQKIPAGMFEGCAGLTEVIFDAKNKDIGNGAFKNCASLVTLDLTKLASSSTLREYAFEGCSSLVMINLSKVSQFGEGTFNYCKSLTSVVLGSNFRTLTTNAQAFDGCTKLVDVVHNSSKTITPGSTGNGGIAKYTQFAIGKGTASRLVNQSGYLFFEDTTVNYLVGYVGEATALTLPANYDGGTYVVYENAFSNNKKIASVKIGAGVSALGEEAFRNCTSLVRVDFTGATISEIPAYAFDGCTAMETLVLATSIRVIGEAAFRNTESLGELSLTNIDTMEARAFQYSGVTKITTGTNLVEIKRDAFSGCERLTQATLPNVKTIGVQAFANCDSLVALSIPAAEVIGEYAFYHNTSLATVALPAGKTISQGAFQECGGLTALTLGTNVAEIGLQAFKDCGKLVYIVDNSSLGLRVGTMGLGHVTRNAQVVVSTATDTVKTEGEYTYWVADDGAVYLLSYTGTATTITLPAKLGGKDYDIFRYAFWGSHVKNVTVPEGVKNIYNGAFAYSDLETISLPASLRALIGNVFESSALRTITMKSGLLEIGAACFKDCENLTAFDMPNTVTTIGMSAFRGCVSMREVNISTSLTKIPDFAFDGCSSLRQIVIPKTGMSYGKRWYYGCDKLIEVFFPQGSGNLGSSLKLYDRQTPISCTNRTSKLTDPDANNGFIFYSNNGIFYLVDYVGTETDVVLPKSAPNGGSYQIFDYAFYNRDDITSIQLSERVTGIGKYAFAECDNLKGVYLGTTLTSDFGVGENLFWGCGREFVVATGFASADAVPAKWSEDFNTQGPASAYTVVYGVTYDLFLTMLK